MIDWDHPDRNDFFLASQFWVTGEMYKRRADLVGFVNGLPLVFVELKAVAQAAGARLPRQPARLQDHHPAALPVQRAHHPLQRQRQQDRHALVAGGSTSPTGRRSTAKGEQGVVSLETMLRGTCDPARLLDLVENFTLFEEERGGTIKLIAKNHQYLGVNNAIAAVASPSPAHGRGAGGEGRLGVFWHTQGSGKSYSMIFFAQKVLRKLPGNWTFVVVTDRQELDDQIYKNFASAGAVTEPEDRVRAEQRRAPAAAAARRTTATSSP